MAATSTSTEQLPETGWEWILFLHRKLIETSRNTEKEKKCARALFQMVMIISFDGADLYGKDGPLETFSVPTYNKKSRSEFKLGERSANKEERLTYFKVIASLVKRECQLSHLLPDKCKNEKWVEAFSESVDILEPESHVCWEVAKEIKDGKFDDNREKRHATMILWLFWVMNNHLLITEYPVDFWDFRQLFIDNDCIDMTEFINKAP